MGFGNTSSAQARFNQVKRKIEKGIATGIYDDEMKPTHMSMVSGLSGVAGGSDGPSPAKKPRGACKANVGGKAKATNKTNDK